MASIFLPWVAAAKALGELSHLECWLGKQANLTSSALAELLEDEETTRHATLQNRAAIDFLLLAHGHGCEEFEGMCCLNLSSNSQSIHKMLWEMKDQLHQLKEEGADWLKNLMDEWRISEGGGVNLSQFVLWVLVTSLSVSLFVLRTSYYQLCKNPFKEKKKGEMWWP